MVSTVLCRAKLLWVYTGKVKLAFSKYEGLGNDFIVLDGRAGLDADSAKRLCDRHLGVGADGVLCVEDAEGSLSMRVINSDGSVPEMCGNGLRCVALHARRTGVIREGAFAVHTDAGLHRCSVDLEHGRVAVELPAPSLRPADVALQASEPWLDHPLEVAGTSVRFTAVSIGNPHLVTFDPVPSAVQESASAVETHPLLAHGANVEFGRVTGPEAIDLKVWERGAGWTRACGTGACAAVVAAVATERMRAGAAVRVTLPGGDLDITYHGQGQPLRMVGPARHVFDGSLELGGV